MEVINTIKRCRATYGSITVKADVCIGPSRNIQNIQSGEIVGEEGAYYGSFYLNSDGAFGFNANPGSDRNAVIEAINSFINELESELGNA